MLDSLVKKMASSKKNKIELIKEIYESYLNEQGDKEKAREIKEIYKKYFNKIKKSDLELLFSVIDLVRYYDKDLETIRFTLLFFVHIFGKREKDDLYEKDFFEYLQKSYELEIDLNVEGFFIYFFKNETITNKITDLVSLINLLFIKIIISYPEKYKDIIERYGGLNNFLSMVAYYQIPISSYYNYSFIRGDLEDFYFKNIFNSEYKKVSEKIKKIKSSFHYSDIFQIANFLNRILYNYNINGTVYLREKSHYAIYNKSLKSGSDIIEITDFVAMRIIFDTEYDVYKYEHFLSKSLIILEKQDYLKKPKKNGYRGIHLKILFAGNLIYEIQLRTKRDHKFITEGSINHFEYTYLEGKNNKKFDKINKGYKVLRSLLKDHE